MFISIEHKIHLLIKAKMLKNKDSSRVQTLRSMLYLSCLVELSKENVLEPGGQKCNNHRPHTNPWHLEEETWNTDIHTTARTQLKHISKLSPPQQDD